MDLETTKRPTEQALVDLAIESWRLARLFQKALDTRDLQAASRQSNQIRYFQKRLDETLLEQGLSLVSLEGQRFDAGMAATALNAADFGPDDDLVVDQMIEPVVMGPQGLVRQGTMMLRK